MSTTHLSGIVRYEPKEMFLTAKSGTPIGEIEATVAEHNQMLAFEPLDFGELFGGEKRYGTIGGVVSTNLCGARRLVAGSVRDHLLGVRFINGLGETIKSGGVVMKNVTGYDLCKLLTGSWGTLGVLSEVTIKVLPRSEDINTIVLFGFNHSDAVRTLCKVMGTPYEVSGAMYIPQDLCSLLSETSIRNAGSSVTLIRVENFSESVAYRIRKILCFLDYKGDCEVLDKDKSLRLWRELTELNFLTKSDRPVWRVSIAPNRGGEFYDEIRKFYPNLDVAFDWSGGLLWLVMPDKFTLGDKDVRQITEKFGGYCMLVRYDETIHPKIDAFSPLDDVVLRLSSGLKSAFDPMGLFNPGSFYSRLVYAN
jgi:glycolate oxidase FAD binding subunit